MSGLAAAITVTTLVAGIGGLVSAFVSAGLSTDAEAFLAESITEARFEELVAPVTALQFFVSAATLATAILTIIWMYRIAGNVRAFGRATTWSPLFAIFGWLLPPGVLYIIPFLMLRELWKASDPAPGARNEGWRTSGDNPVLWLWFALFGLLTAALFVAQLASGDLDSVATPSTTTVAEGLADFGALGWLAALANFVAAVAWVLFVRQLTSRQRTLTNEA